MGPFPNLCGYLYILIAVDYVSKWVEAVATRTNDHSVVCKFVQSNIFSRFGIPRVIISDGGSHFKNFAFGKLLKRYVPGKLKSKWMGPYVMTRVGKFGDVEIEDMQSQAKQVVNGHRLKPYLEGKDVNMLDNDKGCHLPMDLAHRALWAIKNVNLDYKEAVPGKLKSKWMGPYVMTRVGKFGDVEIEDMQSQAKQVVNGHRLKPYLEGKDVNMLDNDKGCHLPMDLAHRALWAIKNVNLDYKEAVPGKLKSKWMGPYVMTRVGKFGDVEIEDMQSQAKQVVNCHRLKPYLEGKDVNMLDNDKMGRNSDKGKGKAASMSGRAAQAKRQRL
ncbi:uncharacterized protein LOC143551131 [Bidens hawaiensis]|uniref:uncharacterized protein LOC143551131 n=1 Tax=Bidens hawaiensis TaxID=980011 RepID=UPI0040499EAB